MTDTHNVHCKDCELSEWFEDGIDADVKETIHYADTGHDVEVIELIS